MSNTPSTTGPEKSGLTADNVAVLRDYVERVINWPGQGVPADVIYPDGRISAAEIDLRIRALRIGPEKDLITTMKPVGARLVAYDTGLSPAARTRLHALVSEGLVTEIHRSPLAA